MRAAGAFLITILLSAMAVAEVRQDSPQPRMAYRYQGGEQFRGLVEEFDGAVQRLRSSGREVRVMQYIFVLDDFSQSEMERATASVFGEESLQRYSQTISAFRYNPCLGFTRLDEDDAQTRLLLVNSSAERERVRSCVVGSAEMMMRFLGGGLP